MKTIQYILNSSITAIIALFLMQSDVNAHDKKERLTQYDMSHVALPQKNLMTAGQPSLKDLETLAKSGTKLVINLRTHEEFDEFNEQKVVEKLGMQYISIEVAGKEGINEQNTALLNEALGELEQQTFVHCSSGNRAGALLAYRAFKFQNKTAEEALAFGKRAGMVSTEAKVRKLLGLPILSVESRQHEES